MGIALCSEAFSQHIQRLETETKGPTRRTMRTTHVQDRGLSQQWGPCQELFMLLAHWPLSMFPLLCVLTHWTATEISNVVRDAPDRIKNLREWKPLLRDSTQLVYKQVVSDYLVVRTYDTWWGHWQLSRTFWFIPWDIPQGLLIVPKWLVHKI